MFEHELRFYQEIAPEVGARVPEGYEAGETCDGIRLVLEGAEARAARRTLIHGDASLANARTSPDGVICVP